MDKNLFINASEVVDMLDVSKPYAYKLIDSGFDNPNEEIRTEWAKVPFKGERLTQQEVIAYLCKEMNKNQ